jgi:hypothetical protein
MLIRTFPVLMLRRSNRHTWLHLLELTMAHPALALRLLMLISSVPNPLTAMMADNGIMAISQISKTRTLTALGGGRHAITGWNTIELTPELQGLMGQFHQSVESQLGQGQLTPCCSTLAHSTPGRNPPLNGWLCLATLRRCSGRFSTCKSVWLAVPLPSLRPIRPACRATCRNVTC